MAGHFPSNQLSTTVGVIFAIPQATNTFPRKYATLTIGRKKRARMALKRNGIKVVKMNLPGRNIVILTAQAYGSVAFIHSMMTPLLHPQRTIKLVGSFTRFHICLANQVPIPMIMVLIPSSPMIFSSPRVVREFITSGHR